MPMAREARSAFAGDKSSVPLARHFVTEVLETWGAGSHAPTVALVTSELVTNSVIHARSDVRLWFALDGSILLLEVADDDSARYPHAQFLDDAATTGRGMSIVENLTEAWGVRSVPDDGKVVWCRMDLGQL